jgi:FtsH-binding integral membrane protein
MTVLSYTAELKGEWKMLENKKYSKISGVLFLVLVVFGFLAFISILCLPTSGTNIEKVSSIWFVLCMVSLVAVLSAGIIMWRLDKYDERVNKEYYKEQEELRERKEYERLKQKYG